MITYGSSNSRSSTRPRSSASSTGRFIETLELHTKFVRPAGTGRLIGRGRVVGVDGELAELDGALDDAAGRVVATAKATARIVSVDPAAALK